MPLRKVEIGFESVFSCGSKENGFVHIKEEREVGVGPTDMWNALSGHGKSYPMGGFSWCRLSTYMAYLT